MSLRNGTFLWGNAFRGHWSSCNTEEQQRSWSDNNTWRCLRQEEGHGHQHWLLLALSASQTTGAPLPGWADPAKYCTQTTGSVQKSGVKNKSPFGKAAAQLVCFSYLWRSVSCQVPLPPSFFGGKNQKDLL